MKLLYEIDPRKFSKKENTMSEGTFLIVNDANNIVYSHTAKSGGWGKGTLECGNYKAVWYTEKSEPAFCQYGIGWLVSLVPEFKSDRTQLAVHPDGGVEGSLGCIVLAIASLDDNVRCRNLLRDIIERGTCILTVYQLSIPQG